MSRACDICGDSLQGYFPNCGRCDSCTDAHGFEADPERVCAACGQPVDRTETLQLFGDYICEACVDNLPDISDPEPTTVDNMRGDFLQAMSTICSGLSRDSWG